MSIPVSKTLRKVGFVKAKIPGGGIPSSSKLIPTTPIMHTKAPIPYKVPKVAKIKMPSASIDAAQPTPPSRKPSIKFGSFPKGFIS